MKLTLFNETNFKPVATSKTSDFQLLELYIRNVAPETFGLTIHVAACTINIHCVYVFNDWTEWTVDVSDPYTLEPFGDTIQETLEFDTLGEAIDFIKAYVKNVIDVEACAW